MRAAVVRRYGPPDVVRVEDVPEPTPEPGGLLVKVHATTVNRTDCAYRAAKPWFIRGVSGLKGPRAEILGTEFAGEVRSIGAMTNSFKVGDRVFGYVEGPFGAHAQYLAVSAKAPVAVIPDGIDYEEAAASTEGAHYAMACIRKAGISKDHDVLVYGASGGIGSAAIQLLKTTGATVTAVCGTEHVDVVQSLGPARLIDYRTEDFTKHDQRYDVILDAVGKSTFGQCRPLLKPSGVYLSSELGPKAQNLLLALVAPLMRGKRVLFAYPRQSPEIIRYIASLLQSGAFKPLIDRRYPLDRIPEAYEYVESGQKLGNVVITVDHPDPNV